MDTLLTTNTVLDKGDDCIPSNAFCHGNALEFQFHIVRIRR